MVYELSRLDESFENTVVYEKYKWLKDQYHKLIILSDFDFETKTEENIKIKIRDLNEGIPCQKNIHYSHTDDCYKIIRKNIKLKNEI